MTKPLLALLLLLASLPLGCSAEDEPPDPLARRAGFCDSWAANACQKTVTDACNSPSVDDCLTSQSKFCLTIVPVSYSPKRAKACLAEVKAAYSDADLTADELQVVRFLAAPCDQLSKGTVDDGGDCTSNDDCDTSSDFICIRKLGATDGVCAEPEEVEPGGACDGDTQVCDETHYCNGENCVAYKKVGAACEGDYQCSPVDRCVIPTGEELGACTARLDLTDPCLADDDCQSHYCVRESDAEEGECASKIRLSITDPLCDDLQ